MSDAVHLLVPFAGCSAAGCAEAVHALQLPKLQRLLSRLAPAAVDAGSTETLSMPHERALASAHGLPQADGLIPLAAWQLRQDGGTPGDAGWAWITPAHWRVGSDHVVMAHPQDLQLDAEDSQALLAAMRPYFAEDGITLEYEAPLRWRARGELFRSLPTASLDRVIGRNVDPWLARGDAGRPLRRLQQEMQMLLYTLPLNEARQRGGQLPVNSFWASGSGALPADAPDPAHGLLVSPYLRDAALQADWPAWQAAWQQLDAQECDGLLKDLEAGRAVRLTLCGEAGARSFASTGSPSLLRRLATLFNKPTAAALLEGL